MSDSADCRHIPDAVCTVLDSWWWTERPFETCRIWHIPYAVCRVLDSWWWTERPSETCRIWHVLYAVCTVLDSWWWTEIPSETCRIWHVPYAVCTVLDSWWWTERPSETCRVLLQNKIKYKKLVHLVGLAIEIYHDARSYERQMWWSACSGCRAWTSTGNEEAWKL